MGHFSFLHDGGRSSMLGRAVICVMTVGGLVALWATSAAAEPETPKPPVLMIWGNSSKSAKVKEIAPEKGGGVEVEVPDSQEDQPWRVMVVNQPAPVEEGKNYLAIVDLAADAPRPVTVVITDSKEPSKTLAMSRRIELDPGAQRLTVPFTASRSSENGHVELQVGASPVPVTVRQLAIVPLDAAEAKWRLATKESEAHLVQTQGEPLLLRLQIDRMNSDKPGELIADSPVLHFSKGQDCALTFTVRAPKEAYVTCQAVSADGTQNLGLDQVVPAKPDESVQTLRFQATGDGKGHIRFLVRGSMVPIDIIRPAASTAAWRFTVDKGASAFHEMLLTAPPVHRIAVSDQAGEQAYSIQLIGRTIEIEKGKKYRVAFEARSDRNRSIASALVQNHKPFENLGFYRKVELETSWKPFTFDFEATGSDADVALTFHLGQGPPATIEIRQVSVTGP